MIGEESKGREKKKASEATSDDAVSQSTLSTQLEKIIKDGSFRVG